MPTVTHKCCVWLYRRGLLKRVYTQNIDGLHLRPSLEFPSDLVIECIGSIIGSSTLVLYGNVLPHQFHDCCDADFAVANNSDRQEWKIKWPCSWYLVRHCGWHYFAECPSLEIWMIAYQIPFYESVRNCSRVFSYFLCSGQ